MKAVFSLGRQMKPLIKLEGKESSVDKEFADEYRVVSLLQTKSEDL